MSHPTHIRRHKEWLGDGRSSPYRPADAVAANRRLSLPLCRLGVCGPSASSPPVAPARWPTGLRAWPPHPGSSARRGGQTRSAPCWSATGISVVRPGPLSRDELPAFEIAQHAAHITGIEPKLLADVGGGGLPTIRQFKKYASLGKRERAAGHSIQHAHLAGIKAIERANSVHLFVDARPRHGRLQ